MLVTLEIIEIAKQACLRKELEKRKKEKDEEKQRTLKKQELEQRVKKRKRKSWEKYQLKSQAIEVLQEKLAIQSKALTDSLNAAADAKKDTLRKAGINAALEAQKNVELTRQLLEFAQKEMETLMGKKPKLK